MRFQPRALAAALLAVSVSCALAAAADLTPGGPPAYAQAIAPRPLEFPRDQGPHPDFRQEWWYLTGNLDGADGHRFGFELTIFRFALPPDSPRPAVGASSADAESSPWRTKQIYLGHFAVTDVARHRFRFITKLSRGALGLAGARADPFRVWIGNWQMGQSAAQESTAIESSPAHAEWQLQAAGQGYVLSLTAQPLMGPVLNGKRGVSRKSGEPGNATYYYSIPRVSVQGTISRDGRPLQVHGLAWLDREWGSGSLGPQEVGWDWFGLQLDDGSCLMFYSLRDRNGSEDPYSAGTWVESDGRARPLSRGDIRIQVLDHWTDPRGARYPSRWRAVAPALGLDVTVRPLLADQELLTSPKYWEGAVDVSGTRRGRPITGRGYVELVGYAERTSGPVGMR
ncbi:MAG TPA: lipocalin-like domain-containing protein [Steroidobacteraceae bacterium]|jgi:predicted secreted hydrolase|nr:lipocalin-like domain-containing protein [Steroidobacteraceae bacterium]